MKKYIKKITACILIIGVVISSFVFSKATSSDADKPSKVLLEAMLNNRSWVLDTIVDGDYSSHPFMDCQNFDDYTYPIFQRVEESECIKPIMTICNYVLTNPLETVRDFLLGLDLLSLQEMASSYDVPIPEEFMEDEEYICNQLISAVYDTHNTRLEEHYEYVLNGVFTTEYESETQISVSEEESRVSEYQTMAAHQNDLSGAIAFLNETSDSINDTMGIYKIDYSKEFLVPYKTSVNTYLSARAGCAKDANMVDRGNLVESLYSMSLVQQTESGVFDGDDSIEFKNWKNSFIADKFMSGANKVINGAGKIASFTSSAINNSLLLESLQYQRKSTIDGLRSLYNYTDEIQMKDAVKGYLNLIDGTFCNVTISNRMGFDALWDSNIIQDAVENKTIKYVSEIIEKKKSISTAQLVSKAVSSILMIELAIFITDMVSGIFQTSERFFQIKSAMSMIETMRGAYYSDFEEYRANRTEGNASKVLNDLLLLKKIRLFTCKMIYDSAAHQLETPIGWVISNEESVENWRNSYQNQVDILLSATLDPIGRTPFEVNDGEELYVYVDKNYAILKRNNKNYIVCEIAERLLGGIRLNNGKVDFYSSSGNQEFVVPAILSGGQSIVQTADVTLTVLGLYHEGERLDLVTHGDIIFERDFDVSSGKVYQSGDARIVVKGNISLEQSDLTNVLITGNKDQTMSTDNVIRVDNLEFAKSSGIVNVTGSVFVWESLKNPSTTVEAGDLLLLEMNGRLIGNHCEGDVALEGHSFDAPMSFGGELHTYNKTVFNSSLKVKDAFTYKGNLLKIGRYAEVGNFTARGIDDAVVEIGENLTSNEDIHISASTFTISGTQKAAKDIVYTTSTVNAAKLDAGEKIYIENSYCVLTGDVKVGVDVDIKSSEVTVPNITSGEITEIDESNFNVTGKCISGDMKVTDSVVNIHEAETDGDATVKNSQYTIETKQDISGNLCAEGGTVNLPVAVVENDLLLKTTEIISSESITAYGTLSSNSSNLQSKNTLVGGDLYLNKSTITADDTLTMRGDYSSIESTVNVVNLVIDGFTAQVIEGEELYPETLTIKNLSSQGAIINSGIFASKNISNPYGKIAGNVYVTALEGCTVENGKYNGNLTLSETSWVADKYDIKGNLKMNGNTSLNVESIEVGGTVIYDGTSSVDSTQGTLTVNTSDLDIGYLDQISGTVVINAENITCQNDFVHKNLNMTAEKMTVKGNLEHPSGTAEYNVAELKVESDFIQQGNVTNNGKIIVEGEARITGTHSGGELELKQDANVGEGVDVQSIILSGKLPQMITGISAKTVDLHFDNSSKDGITVCCPINVSGEFFNNAKNVNGLSNIKIGTLSSESNTQIEGDFNIADWNCTKDTVVGGDLNISGTLTVNPGVTLTVNGTVNNSSAIVLNGATLIVKESVSNSGSITLTDSACLIIEDSAYFKSGTVTVDETSELIVTEDSFVTSTIENNGKMKFSDIYFKSGTVKGIGTYEFCGDVRSDGATFEKINVIFNNKFRQSVIGKEFTFNNVTVNNSSKDGFMVETTVNYYGILEKGNSVIKNPEKLVSKGV